MKKCILDETKICDDCRECDMCDIDPSKICDNCGKCIEITEDKRTIEIDKIYNKDINFNKSNEIIKMETMEAINYFNKVL